MDKWHWKRDKGQWTFNNWQWIRDTKQKNKEIYRSMNYFEVFLPVDNGQRVKVLESGDNLSSVEEGSVVGELARAEGR